MRTAFNRQDVGEDTTSILVADDADGCRKKNPVGKGSELWFRPHLIPESDSVRWQWTYWVKDDGHADKSEACIGDDGHVHDVCDRSPSCINRCIRRGSNNCGTLGTEVWNSVDR